ncbi:MAG TPA: S1C family serine protease [Vicinamibacterales bacterium]|nr:S1C family serine protease [Vicinamibacterales bacterium]
MSHNTSLLSSLSAEIANLVEGVAPAVVGVAARSHRAASGLALGGDLVLTADHVIERDRDIGVIVAGTRHEAAVLGRDPATDLAVLRANGLSAPELRTAAAPATGALVVSVSRTSSGTVSAGLGVITSVGGPLRTPRGVVLPSILRTDAALRPGTAGGALVDAGGQVVGITTPGLLRGLPVAIPAAEALLVAKRLAAREPLGRGYLGVNVQTVKLAATQQEPASSGRGLLVLGVAADGAAEKGGLLVGDILLRFNDQKVADAETLQDELIKVAPGSAAALAVLRGNAVQQITITVGERPPA